MKSLAKKTEEGWAIYVPDISLELGLGASSERPRVTPYFRSADELARYCAGRRALMEDSGECGLLTPRPFTYEKWLKLIEQEEINVMDTDAKTGECCDI